jgi:hypothetical protein
MKINLLPIDLQPTRPSPVPYMPLGGLLAISAAWLIAQLAVATGARNVTVMYRQDYARVVKEVAPTKDIPAKLEKAEARREALKLKAAAVTALTQNECRLSPLIHALAGTIPKSLRLTGLSFDLAGGSGALAGYGSENNTDVEAATFIRILGGEKSISDAFDNVTLNSCLNSKRNAIAVKEFSVSMKFHDRFVKSPEAEVGPDRKDNNGPKNRPPS